MMIDSRAGEEPLNETRKPPSWLCDSMTPENIPSPILRANLPFLRLPVELLFPLFP